MLGNCFSISELVLFNLYLRSVLLRVKSAFVYGAANIRATIWSVAETDVRGTSERWLS